MNSLDRCHLRSFICCCGCCTCTCIKTWMNIKWITKMSDCTNFSLSRDCARTSATKIHWTHKTQTESREMKLEISNYSPRATVARQVRTQAHGSHVFDATQVTNWTHRHSVHARRTRFAWHNPHPRKTQDMLPQKMTTVANMHSCFETPTVFINNNTMSTWTHTTNAYLKKWTLIHLLTKCT